MAKGLADPEAMLARKEAWAEAYRRTPHGKPVELDRRDALRRDPALLNGKGPQLR